VTSPFVSSSPSLRFALPHVADRVADHDHDHVYDHDFA
jgi:hypothetical protein